MNEISSSEKAHCDGKRRQLKEPIKLLGQIFVFFILYLPGLIIWTVIVKIFRLEKEKPIEGNVVLITGSANGLGRHLALEFAKYGAKIACVDLNITENEKTARSIKETYPSVNVETYYCNVGNPSDIDQLHKNVISDYGNVDIIVNNAGLVCSSGNISDIQIDHIRTMITVNLESHFFMAREFLPEMKKRNSGHIVAIASESALDGLPYASVYCSTKHGVLGFMETLYHELRKIPNNKIKTTCVCPYFIGTSKAYSQDWNLRIPELKVEVAASKIVKVIRQEKRLATIPTRDYSYIMLTKLLPYYLQDYLKDTLYTDITVQDVQGGELDELNQEELINAIAEYVYVNTNDDENSDDKVVNNNYQDPEEIKTRRRKRLLISRITNGDTGVNAVDLNYVKVEAMAIQESIHMYHLGQWYDFEGEND